MIKNILIVSAVSGESSHILKRMDKKESYFAGGINYQKGFINNISINILVTQPGILNSIISLTRYLENNTKPDLIIQVGCAGGFTCHGIKVGDIGIASKEIYLHLGVENPKNRAIPSPLPFSLTNDNNISNTFLTDHIFSEKAYEIIKDKTDLSTNIYPFITVSEITSTKEKAKIIHNNFGCGMENMEGAGSAYTAFLYAIPFIEIRSSSNETGERDKHRWDLGKSFKNSCDAVFEVIKNINKY